MSVDVDVIAPVVVAVHVNSTVAVIVDIADLPHQGSISFVRIDTMLVDVELLESEHASCVDRGVLRIRRSDRMPTTATITSTVELAFTSTATIT